MKRPAFQFYPADWRKDVELRSCSVAARGLWMDMLCIAHECEPYGHLTVNGKPMNASKIAGQVGLTAAHTKKLIDELVDNGVARVTPEGVIYSKRMVEDEDLRNRRAEGGKAGSEHGQKGAEHGVKGGRPAKGRGDKEPPSEPPSTGALEPPPSSSSSASTEEKAADAATLPDLKASDLVAEGVDPSHARDWLKVRKTKRAPLTPTAWEGVKAAAAKAGYSPADAVRICAQKSWQGFHAEWLKGEAPARDSGLSQLFARGQA